VFGVYQQYLSCEISSSHGGGAEVTVLWDTMQCRWASSFHRFEASLFPQHHGKTAQELLDCQTLNVRQCDPIERSGTTRPTTQRHIPEGILFLALYGCLFAHQGLIN
jgi:hypothetical protein